MFVVHKIFPYVNFNQYDDFSSLPIWTAWNISTVHGLLVNT